MNCSDVKGQTELIYGSPPSFLMRAGQEVKKSLCKPASLLSYLLPDKGFAMHNSEASHGRSCWESMVGKDTPTLHVRGTKSRVGSLGMGHMSLLYTVAVSKPHPPPLTVVLPSPLRTLATTPSPSTQCRPRRGRPSPSSSLATSTSSCRRKSRSIGRCQMTRTSQSSWTLRWSPNSEWSGKPHPLECSQILVLSKGL